MDYPGEPIIIITVLMRERERQTRQTQKRRCDDRNGSRRGKCEEPTVLSLKVEGGAMSQGMQAV